MFSFLLKAWVLPSCVPPNLTGNYWNTQPNWAYFTPKSMKRRTDKKSLNTRQSILHNLGLVFLTWAFLPVDLENILLWKIFQVQPDVKFFSWAAAFYLCKHHHHCPNITHANTEEVFSKLSIQFSQQSKTEKRATTLTGIGRCWDDDYQPIVGTCCPYSSCANTFSWLTQTI